MSHSVGIAKIIITCENILSFFSSLLSVFVANFFVFLCVRVFCFIRLSFLCAFLVSLFSPLIFGDEFLHFSETLNQIISYPKKYGLFGTSNLEVRCKKEPKSDIGRMLMHLTQKGMIHREPEREGAKTTTRRIKAIILRMNARSTMPYTLNI